ncbi:MAG: hypothetical protein ACOCUH_04525, partial [Bacteriovoracia bacterium]
QDQLKQDYINNLRTCLKPYKEGSQVMTEIENPQKKTAQRRDSKKISKRKSLERKLCPSKNKATSCSEESCLAKLNFSLNKISSLNEVDLVKGCAYSALYQSLKLLVNGSLNTYKATLEEYISPKQFSQLQQKSWNKMKSCINDKLSPATVFSENNKVLDQNLAPLPTDDVAHSILSCADDVTVYSGEFVIGNYLKSSEELKGFVNKDELVTSILNDSYRPCIDHQRKLIKNHQMKDVDPALCAPSVEIEAAYKVIKNEIETAVGEENKNITVKTINNFKSCKEKSQKEFQEELHSLKDSGSDYLNENHTFFKCVTNTISAFVPDYTKTHYTDMIKEESAISDKEFALSKGEQYARFAKKCFDENLEKISSWSEFKSAINNGLINQVQTSCTSSITAMAVGDLGVHETKLQLTEQLHPLYEFKLLSAPDLMSLTDKILDTSTKELQDKYKIKENDIYQDNRNASIIGNAYLKVADQKMFFNDYEKIVTNAAYTNLKEKFLNDFEKHIYSHYRPLSDYDLPGKIGKVITNKCIGNLQEAFSGNSTTQTEMELSIEDIFNIIADGFQYQSLLGPEYIKKVIDGFDRLCQQEKITTEDIYSTANFLIKSSIQTSLKNMLDDYVLNLKQDLNSTLSYTKLEEELEKSSYTHLYKEKGIEQSELKKEIINSFLDSSIINENLKTIRLTKVNKLEDLIEEFIENPEYLEKKLFSDDDLMEYATNNLGALTDSNSPEFTIFSKRLARKLFTSTSKEDFASRFAQVNIEGSIAESGYFSAFLGLKDGTQTKLTGKKREKRGLEAGVKAWNYETISKQLAWDTLSQAQRESLTHSLRDNIVLPSISEDQKEDMDKVTEDVSSFTKTYKYSDGHNFEERIEEQLTKAAKDAMLPF